MAYQVMKSDAEWRGGRRGPGVAGEPAARGVRGAAPGGDRATVERRAPRRAPRRPVPLPRVRCGALPVDGEVRLRLGLAELLRACLAGCGPAEVGPGMGHGAHR